MMCLKLVFLLFLVGNASGLKPAVRLRITQKGLNYAMENAVKQVKQRLESYPIPDIKGHSQILNCDYAVTNINIVNVNIPSKSLRPIQNLGLYSVVSQMDFDLKGDWKYKLSWFSYNGGFSMKVRAMSIAILIDLGIKESHLVVSNVTCASQLRNVYIDVTGPNSWIFHFLKNYITGIVKVKIPKIACEEAKKGITNDLNKQLAKFPVKQNLRNSVTLDYSVVRKPAFNFDSMDMFFKGEFQPSDGHMAWLHQPRELPFELKKERMMYVTIMDHMANSAGHAYYNQGVLKVDVTTKQAPVRYQKYFNTSLLRRLSKIPKLGLMNSIMCPNCDLDLHMEATSPPQIETSNSGVHITVQGIAKFKTAFPKNSNRTVLVLALNVTATAIPKLNGTTLITSIQDVKITTKILKPRVVAAVVQGRIKKLKELVKREIEKIVAKRLSAFYIPLPLSEKFKLIKPKISYGQRHITLESDILLT